VNGLNPKVRAKAYLLLMEYTSIPLFVGLYLLFISGYGLVTRKAAWITLGLLTRHASILLHVFSPFPYIVGILTALHAFGGFGYLILRKVRDRTLALLLEFLNLIVAIIFLTQLTILEFL